MNLKELKEIIDIVTLRDSIEELEIEKSGFRLRIKRSSGHSLPSISTAPLISSSVAAAAQSPPPTPAQISVESEELFYIKSPIVGTFFKSPSPTSDTFVSVGGFVDKRNRRLHYRSDEIDE